MDAILVLLTGALFAGSHLGISSGAMRPQLVDRFGARGYLGVYSALAAVTLGLHIWAYAAATHAPLWFASPAWITHSLMAVALFFVVGGFMVPNPTQVEQEAKLAAEPRGVLRITRHPVMWGFLIWAVAHMSANNDLASLFFFGSFALLAGLGMAALDRRKSQSPDWATFAAATSVLPFAAIAARRNTMPPAEVILPAAITVVLYVALLWGHPYLSGGMAIA